MTVPFLIMGRVTYLHHYVSVENLDAEVLSDVSYRLCGLQS